MTGSKEDINEAFFGFERPVWTAVGGDRYTKIRSSNSSAKRPPRDPHHYQIVLNRMRNRLSSQGRPSTDTSLDDDDSERFIDIKMKSRKMLEDHLSGATLNTVTNFSDMQT
jgi:hypothetical protein